MFVRFDLIVLGTLFLDLASCRPAARGGSKTEHHSAIGALTDSILGDLSYPTQVLPAGRVKLAGGDWESDVLDSLTLRNASANLALTAHGELSGDADDDAVVVLFTDPAATGKFFELVPVIATSAGPRAGHATLVGDRVRPESRWVADERARLRVVTQDSTDGLCCPTRRELQVYRLVGDSLVLERSELLGHVPPEP